MNCPYCGDERHEGDTERARREANEHEAALAAMGERDAEIEDEEGGRRTWLPD